MERAGRDDRPARACRSPASPMPRSTGSRRMPDAFARGLAAYGESDLLCYRAEGPAPLVARQAERWDPLLAWAQQRYDVAFETSLGHHPPAAAARDGRAPRRARSRARRRSSSPACRPWSPSPARWSSRSRWPKARSASNAAWAAATLDEQWQAEQWGEDAEAAARRWPAAARLRRAPRASSACSRVLVLRAGRLRPSPPLRRLSAARTARGLGRNQATITSPAAISATASATKR